MPRVTVQERFNRYVEKVPGTECWFWTGASTANGYGVFHLGDGNILAHRLAWELANGRKVPDGMNVCHSCDLRFCVNSDHLWLGTQRENLRDMSEKGRTVNQNTGKTHCIHGHEFTPENTRMRPHGRGCWTCERAITERVNAERRV